MKKNKFLIKVFFLILWLIVFYFVLFDQIARNIIFEFCLKNELIAPFVMIILQVLLASLALPCSPLSILAGVLWGFYGGIIYSTVATLFASTFTFLLSRYLIKSWIMRKLSNSSMRNITILISKYGWKASALAHINPVLPGSSLGYLFGLSTIGFPCFFFGVILGTVPLQIITVELGHYLRLFSFSWEFKFFFVFLFLFIFLIAYKFVFPKLFEHFQKDLK